MRQVLLSLGFALTASAALADHPVIEKVRVTQESMGWKFAVTISHPDTGWDHFADGWEVLDAQGNVLGYRQLMHPHEQEQPFTRSLSQVIVPDGTREVFIRAHCSVDGWTSEAYKVALEPGS